MHQRYLSPSAPTPRYVNYRVQNLHQTVRLVESQAGLTLSDSELELLNASIEAGATLDVREGFVAVTFILGDA